jgi:excisionase family DNA binding protein
MTEYLRTGQAAKELGVSSHHIRRLCESGEIAAELTRGQQWRIPISEIARLKKQGVPPIPADLQPEPEEEEPPPPEVPPDLYAEPSQEVIQAAEQVKIVESQVRKRRLEREAEEVEDWFRERQERQAAKETAARREAEAKRAQEQRGAWLQKWTQYALESVPHPARRTVELDVHAAIQQALSELQPNQADQITRRLVDAAVQKALGPWQTQQDIKRALETALYRLPWDLRADASTKQRAWEAGIAAVGKLRRDACYPEMESAAVCALEPLLREHQQQKQAKEHREACARIVQWVDIWGATVEEREAAQAAVRQALAALPIGCGPSRLEQAKQAALAPLVAAVAKRKETEARRRAAASKADFQLGHIERYLEQEYEFTGGWFEMRKEAGILRPQIREALINALLEDPDLNDADMRDFIEDEIDDSL